MLKIQYAQTVWPGAQPRTEIELVRDLLGYDPKIEDVKAAHERLTNVLRCLENIEATEKRED